MSWRSSAQGLIRAISASAPDSANMAATSPARRTFSVRSRSEKPRSAFSPWRRLSPSSMKAGRPAAHEGLLHAGGHRRLARTGQAGEEQRRPRRPQRGEALLPRQPAGRRGAPRSGWRAWWR